MVILVRMSLCTERNKQRASKRAIKRASEEYNHTSLILIHSHTLVKNIHTLQQQQLNTGTCWQNCKIKKYLVTTECHRVKRKSRKKRRWESSTASRVAVIGGDGSFTSLAAERYFCGEDRDDALSLVRFHLRRDRERSGGVRCASDREFRSGYDT